jgi:L-lactate dehydrogenase complex protein LldF
MGVHAAKIQIHCMGIEKIVPRTEDLGVFTRLLARSATGQAITTYTSHYRQAKHGGQMHVVIVDNGRSGRLGNETYLDSLKCIRCGACMNTCPVYRRSGGHSYGNVIPGPIGSILAPSSDINKHKDLPFASSLCGSCTNVCPVKIDIHQQLYKWRQEISEKKLLSPLKNYSLKMAGIILASSVWYDLSGKMARWSIRNLPRKVVYHPVNVWGRERELPEVPHESFKQWYIRNSQKKEGGNEQI